MKKILVLVSLLIAAPACSSAPPVNKDVTANANKSAETKATAMASESDIIAKEKAAWDLIKKKDWDGFGKTLASDYLEVLDDGVHDKAGAINSIKDFDLSDITFAGWKLLTIDKDAVIIIYTATVKATFKGEAVPPGPFREASVYVNHGGEWQTAFYQETLATTPLPQPSPMPAQPSKKAASPMAQPAEPGTDAVANEKLVWDALKSRNFDAFASYLASDSLNIEPDGVYDKEGSVKGVSMADFSRAELSNWKALKFDDDASVVTYTVKMPGMKPEQEYHSTIWAKRDGKWQALLHQGTTAAVETAAKPEKKM